MGRRKESSSTTETESDSQQGQGKAKPARVQNKTYVPIKFIKAPGSCPERPDIPSLYRFETDDAHSYQVGDLTLNMNDHSSLNKLLATEKELSVSKCVKCFAYHTGKLVNPEAMGYEPSKDEFIDSLKSTYFAGVDVTLEDLFPSKFTPPSMDVLFNRYRPSGYIDLDFLYTSQVNHLLESKLDQRAYQLLIPGKLINLEPDEDINPVVKAVVGLGDYDIHKRKIDLSLVQIVGGQADEILQPPCKKVKAMQPYRQVNQGSAEQNALQGDVNLRAVSSFTESRSQSLQSNNQDQDNHQHHNQGNAQQLSQDGSHEQRQGEYQAQGYTQGGYQPNMAQNQALFYQPSQPNQSGQPSQPAQLNQLGLPPSSAFPPNQQGAGHSAPFGNPAFSNQHSGSYPNGQSQHQLPFTVGNQGAAAFAPNYNEAQTFKGANNQGYQGANQAYQQGYRQEGSGSFQRGASNGQPAYENKGWNKSYQQNQQSLQPQPYQSAPQGAHFNQAAQHEPQFNQYGQHRSHSQQNQQPAPAQKGQNCPFNHGLKNPSKLQSNFNMPSSYEQDSREERYNKNNQQPQGQHDQGSNYNSYGNNGSQGTNQRFNQFEVKLEFGEGQKAGKQNYQGFNPREQGQYLNNFGAQGYQGQSQNNYRNAPVQGQPSGAQNVDPRAKGNFRTPNQGGYGGQGNQGNQGYTGNYRGQNQGNTYNNQQGYQGAQGRYNTAPANPSYQQQSGQGGYQNAGNPQFNGKQDPRGNGYSQNQGQRYPNQNQSFQGNGYQGSGYQGQRSPQGMHPPMNGQQGYNQPQPMQGRPNVPPFANNQPPQIAGSQPPQPADNQPPQPSQGGNGQYAAPPQSGYQNQGQSYQGQGAPYNPNNMGGGYPPNNGGKMDRLGYGTYGQRETANYVPRYPRANYIEPVSGFGPRPQRGFSQNNGQREQNQGNRGNQGQPWNQHQGNNKGWSKN